VKRLFLLTMVSSLLLNAADLTGTWIGTFDVTTEPGGQIAKETCVLIVKDEGGRVTGTSGPTEERRMPILNGKFDHGRLTFEVQNPPSPVPVLFDLKLDADHLHGEAVAEHGDRKMQAKIDLKRR
jgi:hypothetical protein